MQYSTRYQKVKIVAHPISAGFVLDTYHYSNIHIQTWICRNTLAPNEGKMEEMYTE